MKIDRCLRSVLPWRIRAAFHVNDLQHSYNIWLIDRGPTCTTTSMAATSADHCSQSRRLTR
jgi:hypothetical protein